MVFWPRPKVDSAIVSIWRDEAAASRIADRRFFQDFLRRLFSQRRKHVRGVLAGMYRRQLDKSHVDRLLEHLGMRGDERAELMDPATLIRLANGLFEIIRQADSEDHQAEQDPEQDQTDESGWENGE
jgi:16S rRNA (adenine1518-N6/adenine1519-N6)-dimethyltransferase